MTGTRLLLTLPLELRRRGLHRGLAAACIGGGQGIAAIVETSKTGNPARCSEADGQVEAAASVSSPASVGSYRARLNGDSPGEDRRSARLRPDGSRHRAGVGGRRATRRSCSRSSRRFSTRDSRGSASCSTDGVEKGKVTPEARDETLANLSGTTALEDLAACDLVIEAIVENLDAKRDGLRSARSGRRRRTTIFARTRRRSASPSWRRRTKRPDRFAGLHFFNPVPLMKLVEVIRALTTSDETYRDGRSRSRSRWARSRSPRPIARASSSTGCSCRICSTRSAPYEHGLGTLEDIDKGMKLGCGYPMGPFTLLDFVGLDTTYYIANIMFEEFREPAYAPPPLLKRMVLAGRLGGRAATASTSTDSQSWHLTSLPTSVRGFNQ